MVVNEYRAEEYLVKGVKSICSSFRICVRWKKGVGEHFDVKRDLKQLYINNFLLAFQCIFFDIVVRLMNEKKTRKQGKE